jgi:polyisoprenyl-teichoic acid--peptidoglycan teichoic acid transferase
MTNQDPLSVTQASNNHPSSAETQPVQPFREPDQLSSYQPIHLSKRPAKKKPSSLLVPGIILLVIFIYFFAPLKTNLLLLGIDRSPDGTDMGRSDTIVLTSINPFIPTINMLSIPRDLWVPIPGHGENRINTAHFYAEIDHPGSGPAALEKVIHDNFQVSISYYARIKLGDFPNIIDALGGVTINVPENMPGFAAGPQHMDGTQALAFVRSRKSADDFFRMQHGQLLLQSVLAQLLQPATWPKMPAFLAAIGQMVDTNIPFWQYPRLGMALLRSIPIGIHSHTITREMVTPYTTDLGAQVLLPKWEMIVPLAKQLIGK